MAADLQTDIEGAVIQAFPLMAGKMNKTAGTIKDCVLANCVIDGSITLVGYGETAACVAGDVYAFSNQSVTVVSGTFHLA